MRANVGMKNLIWKCLCWAQLCLNATFGQFVYMTGRHVCTQEKKESQMQPFQKTFCVPEFQTFLRPCRSGEQQSLCTGYRTMYKTVTHTVYKRAEVAKIEYVCCPGWARENIKPGCTKAVCKDECKNSGSCVQPGICKCEPGWTGSSCEQDVNECLIKNGGCQHDCLNEAGSHQCRCNEGFMLKEDGKTCDRSSSSQINLPLANHDEEIHVNSPSEKQRDPEIDDAFNIAASSTLRLQLKDLNLRMEALEEIMVKLSRVIQSAPLEEDPLAIPDGEQNQKTVSGILRKMSEATYLGEIRAPVLQTGSVPAQGEHSLQGTAGPCPKGDSGPPGPKGDTGERGEKGERGLKGEKGDAGDAVAPWSRLPSLDVFGTLVEKVAALESQLEQCGCYSDVRIDVSKHPRDAPNMKGLTEAPRSKVQN